MKKLTSVILLIAALVMLASCKDTGDGQNGKSDGTGEDINTEMNVFIMTAEIKSVGDRVEVDVIESEYGSGIYHVLTSDATEIIGKDGKKIEKSDLRSGDTVEITYSGQVMLSYPPQISAIKIKVI